MGQVTACQHDSRGVCLLCSDALPWWRAARVALGLGEEPPNVWMYGTCWPREKKLAIAVK